MTEEQPNPYNARKEWHNVKESPFVDSTSLFVPMRPDPLEDPVDETANPQSTEQASDDPYKKRYDELKKHHDNSINQLRQELRQLQAEKAAQVPDYKPPKTPEEVAEFTQSNPELAKIVETVAHSQTSELERELQELKQREQKVRAKEARAHLMTVHPDFEEIKVDPDFHSWAETQPQNIQDWIYNNPYDGELAASAVTLYKAAKGLGTSSSIDEEPENAAPAADPASLVPTRTAGVNAAVCCATLKITLI